MYILNQTYNYFLIFLQQLNNTVPPDITEKYDLFQFQLVHFYSLFSSLVCVHIQHTFLCKITTYSGLSTIGNQHLFTGSQHPKQLQALSSKFDINPAKCPFIFNTNLSHLCLNI